MTAPTDEMPPATDEDWPAPPAPSRADEWIELLYRDDAPEARPDMFAAAYEAVAALVRDNPDAARTVGQIIERRASRVPPEQLLGEVTEALDVYLGVDGAYLLHWCVYLDVAERIRRIAPSAGPDATAFLRALLAEFGGTLDFAQRVAFVGLQDWTRIDKRAWMDALTGRQEFAIQLQKLDGSTIRLECSADSLLNLVSHLLELVNAQQSMSGYASDRLTRFADQLQTSVQLLTELFEEQEGGEEDGGEGAESESASP
jgi:hypothetical protein